MPGKPVAGFSGDNVGDKVILKDGNLVLELQLSLFEPGDLQLIDGPCGCQRVDRRVEIAMLDFQRFKALTHLFLGHAETLTDDYPN